MKTKINVGVIFGGRSVENEISVLTAIQAMEALDTEKYDITPIYISKQGKWYTGEALRKSENYRQMDKLFKECEEVYLRPLYGDNNLYKVKKSLFGSDVAATLDVILPALHGTNCEDGSFQGTIEMTGIPYAGCNVLASANGMDKAFMKIVMDSAGIPQANWVVVRTEEGIESYVDEIETKLGYPCFVKPCNTGSSVGVGKAHDRGELIAALAEAAKFDRKILVEEFIDGHEVECAVLGNFDAKAAEVGEIVPTVEFYDFDAKYNDNSTELHIPAELPEDTREQVRKSAVKAFKALDGMGLSRVDFFVRHSDNKVILNEINTMPGFTNISMYPKLWNALGVSYSELLDKLIEYGLKRVK